MDRESRENARYFYDLGMDAAKYLESDNFVSKCLTQNYTDFMSKVINKASKSPSEKTAKLEIVESYPFKKEKRSRSIDEIEYYFGACHLTK